MNAEIEAHKLEFRGNAPEYFRIWIVNLLLTIVTLGVYSAWAKVRKKKYFYRNTRLDRHHFDYHANPVAILKGRLIAVPVFVAYLVSGYFLPGAEFAILLLIILLLPWLIVRSQIFNLRNSSFRNLRFDFARRFKEAYKLLAISGLLTLVTFGLAYPYLVYRLRNFIVNSTRFGRTDFRFSGGAGEFFAIYIGAAMLVAGIAVVWTPIYIWVLSPAVSQMDVSQNEALTIGLIVGLLASLLLYLPAFAFVQSRVNNYTFENTVIEANAFRAEWRARDLFWIYLTNALAIILSVGLLIPWASVRVARYKLERISLAVPVSLDGFVGRPTDAESAAGEEIADIFDFDIGI